MRNTNANNDTPSVGNICIKYFIRNKLGHERTARLKLIPSKLASGVQDINLCMFMTQQPTYRIQ